MGVITIYNVMDKMPAKITSKIGFKTTLNLVSFTCAWHGLDTDLVLTLYGLISILNKGLKTIPDSSPRISWETTVTASKWVKKIEKFNFLNYLLTNIFSNKRIRI